MDKQQAQSLLINTVQAPFNEAQFSHFIHNLCNSLDFSKKSPRQLSGQYIPNAFKDHIKSYKRLATYTDPTQNKIDILWVKLKHPTALSRARTMQRNFVAHYLKNRDEKDAALVATYHPEHPDWRFSLVKMEYDLSTTDSGNLKIQQILTPARRYSFLVGQNEPNHTAQQQLIPILQNITHNPTLADLENAFNIESVTKAFFESYKDHFLTIKEHLNTLLNQHPALNAEFKRTALNSSHFAKKLMGQIVFLYFLQKKGWLGVQPGHPWGSGPKNFLQGLFAQTPPTTNFFNTILEPLFYQALAIERPNHLYPPLNCNIPFLNGGLFEPINGYNWQAIDILLPNHCFEDLFNTFNLYNFTVREDEPLEKEVAVDPEMLGKVFENLLDVTDRKSKGAFYTPREIVHYMCQESLINYLDNTLNAQAKPLITSGPQQQSMFAPVQPTQLSLTAPQTEALIPRPDLETLIRKGEFALANDLAKATGTKSYTYHLSKQIRNNAAAIDQALATIKICDPAIGSGAFPVGLMQEIIKARNVLTTYLSQTSQPSSTSSQPSLTLSQPYPAHTTDHAPRTTHHVPRSTYHFKHHAIQNSIYGVDLDPGAVDIAKLRLWLSLVVDEDNYHHIQPLPNLDYKIVCGNALLGVEYNLFTYKNFKDIETKKQQYFSTTDPTQKEALKTEIDTLITELTGNKSNFDFEIYFSEVFHNGGGFDVVIGNPPYVRHELLRNQKPDLKKHHSDVYTGTADLYVYFYSQSIKILQEGGVLAYITSNKWLRANYGKNLRGYLIKTVKLNNIIDFGELSVFDAATFPMIFIGQKASQKDEFIFTQVKSLAPPYPNILALIKQTGQRLPVNSISAERWMLTDRANISLIHKIEKSGRPLIEYIEGKIYVGLKTGFNKAYWITGVKRDELIALDSKSSEIIKPLAVGNNVRRWQINNEDKWMIVTKIGVNIKTYPAVFSHLLQWETKLKNRSDQGDHWWELRSCSYYDVFEQPKIVFPDIAKEPRATIDTTGMYVDMTAFIIPGYDLYLLAILNSSVVWNYLQQTAAVLGDAKKGGRIRLKRIYMQNIPIPNVTSVQKNSIESLVTQILAIKKATPTADVSHLEKEIDKLVYELYNLTDEEIAIIENNG